MPDPAVVSQLIPTFHVRDVQRAAEWYRDVMGWEIAFVAAPDYAGVRTGELMLHLAQWQKQGELHECQMFVLLDSGVDEYHQRLLERGASFHQAPKDHDYGMRECNLRDLDGNYLHIGQRISGK
ncbi:MAG: VOC family protein [Planctomycetes bacterium]|nr:VOC family protein [Planctomycetota bacterium]